MIALVMILHLALLFVTLLPAILMSLLAARVCVSLVLPVRQWMPTDLSS